MITAWTLAKIVALVLFLIPLWILTLRVLPDYLDLRRSKLELEQDQFYYELDFKEKEDVLDKIIGEEIQNYYVRELGFKKPEDVYLKEEDQLKLISKITARVYINRMTPAVLANVSFYYNFNTDKELQKIIADKVAMGVLDLSLKTNVSVINL